MKRAYYSVVMITALAVAASCNNVSYQKAKSGMLYKIISSGKATDSLIKEGQVVKFNYTIKFNDSLMDRFNSYGKLPGYVKAQVPQQPTYDFLEILMQMKKGDSAITVQMADSLLTRRSPILPPHAKKGDRLIMTIKITDVFQVDSIARADYERELEKDRPRQEKEGEEEMAKMKKQMNEQREKDEAEMEKSGEAAKGIKEMEEYLAGKKIPAQKTGKGTFVLIKEQGTGPAAELGKYVTVKYAGKILRTDSTFESNVYPLKLGEDPVIGGWTEGLQLFKQGGKGTLYIPGFRAYGANPRQGSGFRPFEALIFDVEVLSVSDTMPQQSTQTIPQRRN